MSEVATLCSAPIIGEARARGLDPRPLADGLSASLAQLENRRGRIAWRDFVPFADRAEKMLGAETIETLAAIETIETVPGPIRRMLPFLRDSRPLFLLAPRVWGPWIFRGSRGRCERLADGRLREIVQILPEYAACPAFLSGLRGTLCAMPKLLGQEEAIVTLEQDGREGEFIITPPPRLTRGKLRSIFSFASRDRERGQARRRARAQLERFSFERGAPAPR